MFVFLSSFCWPLAYFFTCGCLFLLCVLLCLDLQLLFISDPGCQRLKDSLAKHPSFSSLHPPLPWIAIRHRGSTPGWDYTDLSLSLSLLAYFWSFQALSNTCEIWHGTNLSGIGRTAKITERYQCLHVYVKLYWHDIKVKCKDFPVGFFFRLLMLRWVYWYAWIY